jgi:SulP family sulfate permease
MSSNSIGILPPPSAGRPSVAWWRRFPALEPYVPKSIICLREGYGRQFLLNDIIGGLTVAVIALPLSMALAIASGVGPEKGLYTAIVAGFLISALGGSRVMVGGPTGAFVVIVAGIVARHGYDGLAIATLMAGAILIIMGIARFGGMIKFIPYPVTTGFTSGIAVLIFSTQMPDFFGLKFSGSVPGDFIPKWIVYFHAVQSTNSHTLATALIGLLIIVSLRRFAPRIPCALVAVLATSALVAALHWDQRFGVETIGSRFVGGIPRMLPHPSLPVALHNWHDVTAAFAKARLLIPEATTIAMLAAIESLLCAVVSDGMIGGRHKSNCELVAQGVANIGSIIFGGIPATGAIARTAAGVKAGSRTPLAGMIHAATLLAFMLMLAPLASRIPLAVLASVLIVVAWNMAEIDHFRTLLRAPRSDIAVLLTTFLLTLLADLSVAVGVGLVLAALLFMRRMSEVTNVGAIRREFDETDAPLDDSSDPNSLETRQVPTGVEVYEINGPFFFGVADRLKDTLRGVERPPKVFILRMRRVPAIDASGIHALEEFHLKCSRQHTRLLLAGVHAQPMFALAKYGLTDRIGEENLFESIDDALDAARQIVGAGPAPKPDRSEPEVARQAARRN